jgi:hypothetical protein
MSISQEQIAREAMNDQISAGNQSDKAEAIKLLDDDSFTETPDGQVFSKIDFNHVVDKYRADGWALVDFFQKMHVIAPEWNPIMLLKRGSVSVDGRGRSDKVRIIAHDDETEKQKWYSKMMGGDGRRK